MSGSTVSSAGGWFLVRTAGGQEGWANDRDLSLQPVSRLYVRRWGVHLRQAPGQGRIAGEAPDQ